MSELNTRSRRLTIPSLVGYGPLVLIGRGGSASVYRSHDMRSERRVAIKIIEVGELSPATLRRFERECKALGSLSAHPNIVTVLGSGTTPDGKPYLVMDLVEGGSLAERLRRHRPVPAAEIVSLGQELLTALGAAHEIGILHRNIRPANVLFARDGHPQLVDFAISSIPGGHRTRSGNVTAGTAFAAPEVIEGRRAEKASDLYSLAATLAALAIGWPVFARGSKETSTAYIHRILRDPPRSLEPYGASRELSDVLHKGMAKMPSGRYPTAAEFLEALAGVPEAAPTTRLDASVDDVVDDVMAASVAADIAAAAVAAPRIVPAATPSPVDDTRRRRPRKVILIATVAVLIVVAAAVTLALWPGASRAKVAAEPSAPHSPVADVSSHPAAALSAPFFRSSCTGRRCTFALADTAIPASELLTWRFGDGTTRSGPPQVSHSYRTAGRYTASLIAGRGAQSATSKTVSISIARWPRALHLRAERAGSTKISVTVTGPAQCRPARYTLERRGATWGRVRSGRLTSTVTTMRVPGASTYRLDLAETDAEGGFCPAVLSAPVTVRAAEPNATPPAGTSTHVPSPTTTSSTPTTPTTPTTRSTPPSPSHTPPPVKYTPPPVK